MLRRFQIQTSGKGLVEVTSEVTGVLREASFEAGLCTIFVQHTSASLTIQENADPAACRDLENWLERLVPENDPLFTHTEEGPDDMPSHIKAALTSTSLGIPVEDGRLVLGTWQGIFLWEHRSQPKTRSILVHLSS